MKFFKKKEVPQAVFGVVDPQPYLWGFPRGKKRVRMRHDDFVRVYVKHSSGGVRCFVPVHTKSHPRVWMFDPKLEIGANINLS